MRYAVAAVLIAATAAAAGAQPAARVQFPTRPVRIVVPSAPGGGTDLVARYFAQVLGETWGQTVIVDNRSGGATTIGIGIVAKSQPDGYTLLLTTVNFAFLPATHTRLPYDPVRDFAPVTFLASSDSVLTVNSGVAATSVSELVALARSKPGELRYASGGNGSVGHFVSELFQVHAKVKLAHIPYKGTGPGVTAVTGGEVHVLIANIASLLPHIRSGRVRGLAVTGGARSKAIPELPTIAESGVPGFEYRGWYGTWLPANTAPAMIDRLNADLNRVVRSPEFAARFRDLAMEPLGGSALDFSDYVTGEMSKWREVAKRAGIRIEP